LPSSAGLLRNSPTLLRRAYSVLLYLVLPFIPLRLWWRGRREPGYRKHIGERFGFYPAASAGSSAAAAGSSAAAAGSSTASAGSSTAAAGSSAAAAAPAKPVLWIHAVSLGETRAAEPLVKVLRARFPDHQLLMTHMTATGRQAAQTLFPGALTVFLPYDYPFAVERFIRRFRPRLGILMETEIWPNLIRACKRAAVPLVLANGRLSERSARGYQRVAGLASEAFGGLAAVAAQTQADAARLRLAGAPHVVVTGNLKFDISNLTESVPMANDFRRAFGNRPVLLLASTREGEEALILDAIARWPLPKATLVVVVPRHPQRFDEVARMMANRVLPAVRRSANQEVPPEVQYVLGDSMGEMAAYYLSCDVAFVGGSLVPVGGQNLIEACAAGAPVIVGPSTYNFEDAARLAIEAGAALRVKDARELVETASQLLGDEQRRKAMADAGRAFTEAHRGAAERVAQLVDQVVNKPPREVGVWQS